MTVQSLVYPALIIQPDTARVLHRLLLQWYRANKRDFYWRRSNDPYVVLVSEFMLQQTQTARVAEKLPQWLEAFPDIDSLARASKRAVLLAWSGMGYNRRVLNLHAAAGIICSRYWSAIPDSVEVLQTLPGLGRYTASAVACFGFRKRLPVVDINIRRVFSRLTIALKSEADLLPEKPAWEIAAKLLPPRSAYNWNQALMDLGAMICTAVRPQCSRCPLQEHCLSAGRLSPVERRRDAVAREVPGRIYRGKTIEYLRTATGHRGSFVQLGRHLMMDFGTQHYVWLTGILSSLVRDGMIEIKQNGKPAQIQPDTADPISIRVHLIE